MQTSIDKKEVASKCRVLGIHANFDLKELKRSRDRLAKLYHPDKNIHLSEQAQKTISERFKIIQNCYDYLKENHQAIQDQFQHLKEFSLTSKGNKTNRSHWVYTTVQSL